MSTELNFIVQALGRIEGKLDQKAEQSDFLELEKRVRDNETSLVRVYTVGSLVSLALGWIGWK